MTRKTSSSFTICHIFSFEIKYFPVLLSVGASLARLPKRNKCKVVSGSRVTLPVNFARKSRLSFNPLARVTLAVGLPYLLVNRALVYCLQDKEMLILSAFNRTLQINFKSTILQYLSFQLSRHLSISTWELLALSAIS